MKKPYDYQKDYTFCPPTVVRTSNVRVTKRNLEFIREFFSSLMEKNSAHEVLCFVSMVSTEDGSVARSSRAVSSETFNLKVGVVFQYIHTVGVSERIIVNEDVDGGVNQSVYTISG